MKKLFKKMIQNFEDKKDMVLCTIIASSGSTPRGKGARMIVTKDDTYGTIGGGNIEYRSTLKARDILDYKESQIEAFVLNREDVSDLGMICGGNVTVYFEYIAYNDLKYQKMIKECLSLFDESIDVWQIMDITDYQVNNLTFYSKEHGLIGFGDTGVVNYLVSKAGQFDYNSHHYYQEKINRAGVVYIFGGGHIAQKLAPMLVDLDFKVVVVEDREDFCNRELFPTVYDLKCIKMTDILQEINFTSEDYACIMTRGHEHDYLIQKTLINTDLKYMGVMGSIPKMQRIAERFRGDGVEESQINRFKSPIGTAILAETPAEIAVSIAGELILERAKRNAN